jgi:copper chaperone CopZ
MKLTSMRAACALLLPLLSLACQGTTPLQQAPLAEFRNDHQIGLPVFGMSCPKCANNITHQLIDLEGVMTVEVDMGQGFVTVQAEPGKVPTRAVIVEAITAAGFTVPPQDLSAPGPGVNMPRIQQGPARKE